MTRNFRNPLVLPDWTSEELYLVPPCPVGFDEMGAPIPLDVMDFDRFGKPMMEAAGGRLVWDAVTPLASPDELSGLYPFHGGAMVSPRVRDIIEAFGSPDVEYIPLRILAEGSREQIAEWWFANVFHWKDIFDFDRSRVVYRSFPKEVRGSLAVSARFGPRMIREIHQLAARDAAYEGGLFLARAPAETIWHRVFIGLELAERINAGVPDDRKVYFDQFRLKDRPQPPRVPPMRTPKRWWWPWQARPPS